MSSDINQQVVQDGSVVGTVVAGLGGAVARRPKGSGVTAHCDAIPPKARSVGRTACAALERPWTSTWCGVVGQRLMALEVMDFSRETKPRDSSQSCCEFWAAQNS